MEPSAAGQQAMDRDQEAVHDWRVSQLMRLGLGVDQRDDRTRELA
jgi:hypothetical protein